MLEYDRIDISEEIDVYKTSASKECDICNLLSNKQRRDIKQSKKYYESDKERLGEQAKDKCRNLSEEDKNKKREYGKNRYRNISEEKKEILKEYQRNYRRAKRSQYNNE